jgi:hypothetical protein
MTRTRLRRASILNGSDQNQPERNESMKSIIVTGDVVVDAHLYGGVKTAATSFSEPGTVYTEHLGGAVLTHELISAAADARGIAWDAMKRQWDAKNAGRRKEGKALIPRPDDLGKCRPSPAYESHFDLDITQLKQKLPSHLRSYGVWSEHPANKKGAKERVWRIERHFGYGPTKPPRQGDVFKRSGTQPINLPTLTLIDDGAIFFRHVSSKNTWPEFSANTGGHYLLKMSLPLCRGDLWAALEPVMNRLIVVVSAIDLRREDARINSRLSWELCAEHTIGALQSDPIARGLLQAAHVIVSFQSAGALWVERRPDGEPPTYRLFFDPTMLEGDFSLGFDGTVYGFQTCLTAGIAHHLMQKGAEADAAKLPDLYSDRNAFCQAMSQGIAAGLLARRRLLELGHGLIDKPDPGFPVQALGQSIADNTGGYVSVEVPPKAWQSVVCQWTILNQSEATGPAPATAAGPLTGLAQLTARYGYGALSHVPAFRLGNLFTVDRSEIESYRTLYGLIRAYEAVKVQKKPLSIGVFGPPGAGKSFGVKALAKGILGEKVPFIEFNLSQFKSPDELIGAFHRVRDAVLGGVTPVAFWDEFDSQSYKWLQYLLAPMQDGSFQEGQITHPIGKCIFIFAGGTSHTLEEFGVKPSPVLSVEDMQKLSIEERRERREIEKPYREFQLLKGPDFISRLHGFLNVLGPNPRPNTNCPDITWPIRRAIMLRGILQLKDDAELDIDPGLLNALLNVSCYRHGARSFEKVINALLYDHHQSRLHRSALPPLPLLECETNAGEFKALLTQRDDFKNHPDLEALAAAIHYNFLKGEEKSKVDAAIKVNPSIAWTIHPSIQMDYDQLSADVKASNRAAARRIPDHLALIGHVVEPQQPQDDGSWKAPLSAAIDKHIERLARAEHLGWCAERVANGWTYDKVRDNNAKHHPLLVPWAKLSPSDQEKDRVSAWSIPTLLEIAKFKAVPVQTRP